ncbi:MAG: WD40/YVTN/BNR-like repeat-containing protein [Planctomycetota bacterium]
MLSADSATWVAFGRDLPDGAQVFELATTDQSVYAALYSKGLYRIAPDGGSWQQVGDVKPLRFHIHGEVFLAGHNPGGVYRSVDAGRTWELGGGTFDHSPTWVLGHAGPNLLVGTSPGAVAMSRDSGASWQPSAAGLPAGASVVALASDRSYALAAVVIQHDR